VVAQNLLEVPVSIVVAETNQLKDKIMDKNKLEMLAGILGGMGMIWYASNSNRMGSRSPISWHFTIADSLLNRTGRNVGEAVAIAQQQYGDNQEACQLIKAAIFELGKQGSSYKMFDQRPLDGDVIDRPRVNNRNPDLGRRQDIAPFERPNRQRYKIFWDCVTRHVNPQQATSPIIAQDGGFYGELLQNRFICDHNDGDGKWVNCTTAAGLGVQQDAAGDLSFADLMNAITHDGNLTGYECVLAAMPIDDRGYILPPQQGMALRKVYVAAAYMDRRTATNNWAAALPLIRQACAGGDILDLDNYMRT